MASALALQCSTTRAMKTHTLGAGQFMEFIVPLKGMKHMNMGLILDDYKTFQQATGTMILLVYQQ